MGVGRVILAEIRTRVQGNKTRGSEQILLDRGRFDAFAVDSVPSTEVKGINGQLILGSKCHVGAVAFQQQIVLPLHTEAEPKVVQPAGTNCPKTVGRTQGT